VAFTFPQQFASGTAGFFGFFPDYGGVNYSAMTNASVEQVGRPEKHSAKPYLRPRHQAKQCFF
jgi:hypothetical protein